MSPCCNAPLTPAEEVKKDLVVRRCTKCGNRHFELTVDPLVLNIRGV